MTSSIWFIAEAAHLTVRGITQGNIGTDMLYNAQGSTIYLRAAAPCSTHTAVPAPGPARTEAANKKIDFAAASSWKVLDAQAGGYNKGG